MLPLLPKRARRRRAFSLIETMVVVAILGVVAALTIPRFLPEIHKAQLDGDTESAANFLARARSEAMFSKRCTRVRLATATKLVAERLNSFDCDTGIVPKIDTLQPTFIQFDFLDTSTPKVNWSIAGADGGQLPATPGGEIRFRPNGRVFSNDAIANTPNLANDDAILVVKQLAMAGEIVAGGDKRRILVDGNGLICALDRGKMPNGGPTDWSCP